ncbi:MAG: nucleotidyltransferase [Cyclobacteriaceae bacterium]|nr:nucleotidyltransferase [Cyclobacteriaceae bacterium]
MLTEEQKKQFNEILEELGQTLDISESEYEVAVKSYEAVGKWLSDEKSTLAPYKPEILPQGSFMLGTMIKPVNDSDDMDIDLVCQLKGKNPEWTQENLKQKVGDRIKDHETYKQMLDEEGRRCWTLLYRQDSKIQKEKFHMDILPSIVDSGYRMVLEKAFSATELKELDDLALRITDTEEDNYESEKNHLEWLKSNPFGYGRWFFEQAKLEIKKAFFINESIQPVPKYQKDKLPLQRVIQILKRHRDMMFKGDEDKPISIIITTLAAKAYRKETDILTALRNIVNSMEQYIEEYNPHTGEKMKWISNPVNNEENFADKWVETPQKQENFYAWLGQVKADIAEATGKTELKYIMESLKAPFGEEVINKAFGTYGDKLLKQRESGKMKMAAASGTIGAVGRTTVTNHNPYGKNK